MVGCLNQTLQMELCSFPAAFARLTLWELLLLFPSLAVTAKVLGR